MYSRLAEVTARSRGRVLGQGEHAERQASQGLSSTVGQDSQVKQASSRQDEVGERTEERKHFLGNCHLFRMTGRVGRRKTSLDESEKAGHQDLRDRTSCRGARLHLTGKP